MAVGGDEDRDEEAGAGTWKGESFERTGQEGGEGRGCFVSFLFWPGRVRMGQPSDYARREGGEKALSADIFQTKWHLGMLTGCGLSDRENRSAPWRAGMYSLVGGDGPEGEGAEAQNQPILARCSL